MRVRHEHFDVKSEFKYHNGLTFAEFDKIFTSMDN